MAAKRTKFGTFKTNQPDMDPKLAAIKLSRGRPGKDSRTEREKQAAERLKLKSFK